MIDLRSTVGGAIVPKAGESDTFVCAAAEEPTYIKNLPIGTRGHQ
eukprot:CAMPEP_0181173158 /NCGR_PEP_ID=MMETSP1096-20121128/2844_1 /TAXON_ID=156174 ORGANISM="Chrysochromulina ericina, Strain CCMP281" /NCGR_SAMPLE_ID=MMETSP1096 /ASSEMBLY_ACC=CAM_ASM_000453 /LENGTH=44 /DNA_ID= /DNA_START= /DNA_END= /DNA_ORIENTATION=